ncbi:MAG: TonB-dependent receptor [Bacteroidetes bacterium]|nr:TonB-dependent receptor [Bacteroidota bacterium]
MIKKLLFTLSVMIFAANCLFGQTGIIKGTIVTPSGEPQQYQQVMLYKGTDVVGLMITDEKGEFQFFGVSAGTFEVIAGNSANCSGKAGLKGISNNGSATVMLADIELDCSNQLGIIDVKASSPIKDPTSAIGMQVSGEQLKKTVGRNINSALSGAEGTSMDAAGNSNVRGNRSDGQKTIIDGVVVRNGNVNFNSIESIELLTGAIPAEFGDGTSFRVINTKGAPSVYTFSSEVRGSVDGYNNFLAAISFSGPLIKGEKPNYPSKAGFLLSGEAYYNKDGSPSRGGTWRATDEAISTLKANPLRYDDLQLGANYSNGEYLTSESFYKQRVRQNAESYGFTFTGKIDIVGGGGKFESGIPKNTIKLTVGGTYEYSFGKDWGLYNSVFNNANNGVGHGSTLRIYGRLTHRVKAPDSKNPDEVLKNIMYDVNVSYSISDYVSEDSRFKDNYFKYGHIGKFTTKRAKIYNREDIWIDSVLYRNMVVLKTVYDSIVTFDASTSSNPDLAIYTQNFVDRYSPEFFNNYFGYTIPYNLTLYSSFGALRNGDGPSAIYGLYPMPGSVSSGYGKSRNAVLSAKANISINLNDHDVKLGFEIEKLTYRSWSVAPYSLWTIMRQKQNFHISQLDVEHPYTPGYDYFNVEANDTIEYNQLVNLSDQSSFDRNLRIKLGLDPNGDDWLDIDSYDPSLFEIGMFSADELLIGISGPMVGYYGYDYTGTNRTTKKTSITDFFDGETDNNGNKVFNYAIGAYEPIYLAFYIQDKLSIKNLVVSAGIRVDRFDANQQVLKDPFLFREAHTVGSLKSGEFGFGDDRFVSNAEDSWVVYINEKGKTPDGNTQSIIGYRDGRDWYDANGQQITDPTTLLGATGGPALIEALDETAISKVSGKAFEDYIPQWSVMPRLSFSFPVGEQSLFYANYNVISYRPTNLQLNPVSYLFIEKFGSNAGNSVNNPNLKPQRSIDYEIGFQQRLSQSAGISLSAYYSEKRDQIQSYRFTGAYPSTYYSFDNIDFGTVQGFTLGYNLIGTKNLTFRANYTLQFAKGTGSSAGSNLAIIASGQPNLRTLTNLSFDQRHRMTATINYGFGPNQGPEIERKSKDGKTTKKVYWLQNTSASIFFSAASGMPYSRSNTPFSNFGLGGKSQLSGSINGSNRPWIFQCDVRIDKSFDFKFGKKDENNKPSKQGNLSVYIDIANIFNFKNVVSVYTYTGNPEDDGVLASEQFQQLINSQIYVPSFVNYYNMAMRNPYNYSSPTTVSLGVLFGF